jgi:hypothetical protein
LVDVVTLSSWPRRPILRHFEASGSSMVPLCNKINVFEASVYLIKID